MWYIMFSAIQENTKEYVKKRENRKEVFVFWFSFFRRLKIGLNRQKKIKNDQFNLLPTFSVSKG